MNCKSFFSVAYKVIMATGVIAELVNIVVCYKNSGKLSTTTNGAVADSTAAPQNGVEEGA